MIEKREFLDLISDHVFILDGAMGSNIQALDLSPEDYGAKEGCNEYLVLTRPDVIQDIHSSFLEVGCMGVETNTIGGSRLKLSEYGLATKVREINRRAAEIAREVCDRYPPPKLVFGSVGPTGMLPSSSDPDLGAIPFDTLADVFEEQALALIEGGVDVLLIETSQDILEAKAAVVGSKRAAAHSRSHPPIGAQVTLDENGRMLLGTDIGAALVTLEAMGVDFIGINCSTGPEEMRDSIRFLTRHAGIPISCLPNMGMPENIGGTAVYPLEPEDFAHAMAEFVEKFGVNIVGGCCGSTPAHLRVLVQRLEGVSPRARDVSRLHAVSSGMSFATLKQEPPPLLVGERINAQGSRKMKEFLLKDDFESIAMMARDQAEKGAHVLDVCVALTERNGEKDRFLRLAKILSQHVSAPIMIDSTDSDVVNEAIKNYPGRVIVNSVNLESGEKRLLEVGPAIRDFGACVIALTIDEKGMAKTCERKVSVAERTARILRKNFAVEPERIIFDPLTFTLATGEVEFQDSAVETLDGIATIKTKIPGSLTILGISNVSFGLKKAARAVLNSVFLYHAVKRGLDLAIVNPGEIKPYSEIPEEERRLAEDLIFNRKKDALSGFVDHFEKVKEEGAPKEVKQFASPEEEIRYKILNRLPDKIEALLDETLERKTAVEVINEVLLPAMREVGDKFASGELILPFVLQSAEAVKRAFRHVEQFLEKRTGYAKGRVILATVFGDVHDIGKNLVGAILSNNGYDVKDLGKRVPAHTIVEEAERFNADAVGLSALLVSTSRQLPVVVHELLRAGVHIPVLVGGAAVTRRYAQQSAMLEERFPYPSGLFYARDAFEGLAILDRLSSPESRENAIEQYRRETLQAFENAEKAATPAEREPTEGGPSLPTVKPPEPPFWGITEVDEIDLDAVYARMDLSTFYKRSWAVRGMERSEYDRAVKETFEPLRLELQREAKERGYLAPKAVYGYFPCKSSGETLAIYDPGDRSRVMAGMHFPRQRGEKHLSIADYFRGDVFDVVPLLIVTIGPHASEVIEAMNSAGEYTKSYALYGLSAAAAEGLADDIHQRIRTELGLGANQGKRYSHGYPACPDLSYNQTILELLEAEERLGITVTEAYQFVPEQTTAALIVHHPSAEYFGL